MPFTLPNSSVPNAIPAATGLSREILDFIERIRGELPGETDRSRLAIKTYLKMILLALVNHYTGLDATREASYYRQSSVRRLAPLLEHLEQRYGEPIRVHDAAKFCAMSDCCFMQLFKEVTGQSFVTYLNHFRVTRAQDLLTATDWPISDISLETGFCNQSYFGVIFRRIAGMTPLEVSPGATENSSTDKPLRLDCRQTAIDSKDTADTVVRIIGSQKRRDAGQILRSSQSARGRDLRVTIANFPVGKFDCVHGCIDRSRNDRVDPDVIWCVVGGHGAHQSDHASLAGAVCGKASEAEKAGRRCHMNNGTSSLLEHPWNRVFRAEPVSAQIHSHRAVPCFISQFVRASSC